MEDVSWRRLQTIMRKHEEKREAAEKTQEATTADLTSGPASTAFGAGAGAIPGNVSGSTGPDDRVIEFDRTATASSSGNPRAGTSAAAPELLAPGSSSIEASKKTADEGLTGSSQVTASISTAGSIHRALGSKTPASLPADTGETGAEIGEEAASAGTKPWSNSAIPEAAELEAEEDEQPLPLEAIWPVQISRPVQRQVSGGSAADDTPKPPAAAESSLSPESAEITRVQAALQKVSAGKPTDSSIELIPPKGRKPGITSPSIPRAMGMSATDQGPTTGRPVQRQAAAEAQNAGTILEASDPRPSIQRQDESHPSEKSAAPAGQDGPPSVAPRQTRFGPEAVQPDTVPTEIGPLPADLWHYLGQRPPSPPTAPPPADDPTGPQEPTAQITPTGPAVGSVQRAFGGFDVPSLSDVRERASGAVESVRDTASSGAESGIETARGFVPTSTESAIETARGFVPTSTESAIETARGFVPAGAESAVGTARGFVPAGAESAVETARGLVPAGAESAVEAARGLVPAGAESAIETARGLVPAGAESAIEAARGLVPAGTESAIEAARGLAPGGTESAIETARGLVSNAADATQSLAQQITEPANAPSGGHAELASQQSERQDKNESTKTDLDKLARLVYGEIKRRLNLEKERGRGRF